ncbi:hypothetical protein P9112_013838 [Eukaryota sp. TZLM1-RC]
MKEKLPVNFCWLIWGFLDALSIDPCNSSNEHLINSDVNNPLFAGEKYKIAKYAKPISSVNENSHAQYNLCPFVFSLLGSLGEAAMTFLEILLYL